MSSTHHNRPERRWLPFGAWKEFQGVFRSTSHLHLRTTGQAESVCLLCRQTVLQRPPYCADRKWREEQAERKKTLSSVWVTVIVLFQLARDNKFGRLSNKCPDSRDFRLTRDRLLSRGCVRWPGPWVADRTIRSMISSAVSSVPFNRSSLAAHHGATRPEAESEGHVSAFGMNKDCVHGHISRSVGLQMDKANISVRVLRYRNFTSNMNLNGIQENWIIHADSTCIFFLF